MTLLSRYVLGELLKVFFVALACMTALMILFGATKEALNEGLGVEQIVRLVPYILPDALRFTIPGTVLFAVASVFGRMSGANEIVALKSLGISPMAILWPTYMLCILLSAVTVVLNDVAVSWGRNGVRRVVLEAVEEIVYSRLRMHKSYAAPDFSINVKDVQDRVLVQPMFTYYDKKQGRSVTVRCERAELASDGSVLTVVCYDGTLDIDGEITYRFPDELVRDIDIQRIDGHDWSPSWMPLATIRTKLQEQQHHVLDKRREMAAKAALQLVTGDIDALRGPEWETEHRVLQEKVFILHRLQTEPPRRWSNGFSCFCFAWVGASVAIRRRNANFLSSFFVCFLPILIVYYPLLAFGVQQAKSGSLPPETVWLGNLVLLAWGAWELRKLIRY